MFVKKSWKWKVETNDGMKYNDHCTHARPPMCAEWSAVQKSCCRPILNLCRFKLILVSVSVFDKTVYSRM